MQKHDDVMYPYKLFFYDCIWEGNKIIYPASNCSAICETDITTGDTIIIEKVHEKKETLLFNGIYKWREYLLMPGRNARTALHLFNLETKEWSYITIEQSKKEWLNFREENIYEYHGYLYIFSYSLVVLKVNIDKRSIDYLFYPDIQPDDDIRGEIIFLENVIYIPMRHRNKIYKFDMSTEQWTILEVNTELRGIDTLCFDGRLFWMTGMGQMICSWDEKNNTSVSYKKFPRKFKKCVDRNGEEGFWFCRSIVYGNSVYFVPSDANIMIEFDINSGRASEFWIEDEWEEEEDTRVGRLSTVKYMGAKKKDNVIMMLSNKNKNLIFIDLETKKVNKTEIKLCIQTEIDKLIVDAAAMQEGVVNLNAWLKYVGGYGQEHNIKNKSHEDTMGKIIYSLC